MAYNRCRCGFVLFPFAVMEEHVSQISGNKKEKKNQKTCKLQQKDERFTVQSYRFACFGQVINWQLVDILSIIY